MPEDDRRLIEDYLPIEAISDSAASEPRTKGHISTMHVWRARRPLLGCRAAIYGALVPLSRFLPKNGPEEKRASLGRANVAKFLDRLCKYPGNSKVFAEAQRHILEAHAERLSWESGEQVTAEDIETGRAPRPRVLDIFAGGGAIPLEAARLGCDSQALELNPVAHIIELCTVTYPQHFGVSLADDVEQWGNDVLQRTQERVRDVLAHIPVANQPHPQLQSRIDFDTSESSPELSIVAYYWTRTIPCPNPQCRGTVPLYRQTWLRRKPSGYVALKPEPDPRQKLVKFSVVHAQSEAALGFDPSQGSRNSSTTCPFCQAPVSGPYVREFGNQTGFGQQLMCVIALNPEGTGKLYIADESLAAGEKERQAIAEERSAALVATLWDQGISGADLVIACVGAGLHAFTRFARVEYANGEEMPAERFLTEVETVVLENILARLSKETGTVGRTSLAGVDPATRFYTLWRYTYRATELEAGEAIIFANGTHVELDGSGSLSTGARVLVEKKKGKYRLRSYAERGSDDKLGMPADDGQPVPVIDALHRTLWLMENRPATLAEFLREAKPNREQMRLVAQALAGPALKGGELADVSPTGELAALARLTANWRSVIEDADMTSWAREERLTGQRALFREGAR